MLCYDVFCTIPVENLRLCYLVRSFVLYTLLSLCTVASSPHNDVPAYPFGIRSSPRQETTGGLFQGGTGGAYLVVQIRPGNDPVLELVTWIDASYTVSRGLLAA